MDGLSGVLLGVLVIAAVAAFVQLDRQAKRTLLLEHQLQYLQDRLFAVEQRLRRQPDAEAAAPAPVRQAASAPPVPIPDPAPIPAFAGTEMPAPPVPPPLPPLPAEPAGDSWEQTIGRRWFVWAGIGALFLSMVFLVQYAFANWLGPQGRVLLATGFGIALMIVGSLARRRGWRPLGEGLLGGGLAILYAAIFAATTLLHLLPPAAAFACMIAVTATGMTLAVRDGALSLGVLAVLGGFLTPVLVQTQADGRDALFAYLLLLDLGVLGVAAFKQWRGLDLLALSGTWLLFAGWHASYYAPAALGPALAWLGVFALLFQVLPFVYHLRTRTVIPGERFALALLNAGVVFALAWRLLYADHRPWLALLAVGLSAVNLALGALTRRRVPADRLAVFGFLLLAAAFATLAVPLALRGDAVLLAWTMEAPVLLLLGYRYRDLPLRIGSGLVLVLALLRLFGTHGPLHPEAVSFTPFLNGPFLTALAVPAAAGVLALLHAWWAGSADRTETDDVLRLAAGTGGALLALLLVQLELLQWLTGIGHPEVTHYASALVWGTGGLLFVLLGLHRTHRALVVVGTLLLVLACGFAAFTFSNGVAYALPVLNPRFGLIALVLVYGFLAWRAAYRRQAAVAWQQAFFGLFEGAALLLVSLEAVMNVGASVNPEHARWLAQLNLTLTWAVVASVQLIAGFRRRSRGLRLAGLALFGATAVKLLLIDLAVLEQIYRILAFFIVGLLMVGAGYLYQRWEQALREDAAAHCADDGR